MILFARNAGRRESCDGIETHLLLLAPVLDERLRPDASQPNDASCPELQRIHLAVHASSQ